MTPATMATLRLAATVAHALPGVGLRLRNGGCTILEVSGAPCSSPRTMSPCAFRMAVARAHQLAHTAARLGSLRFLSGEDLALDIRVSSGDRIWPSGTYRIGVGDGYVHGFATTLAPRHCRRLISQSADTGALPAGLDGVGLHLDAATEVTLVHAVTPVGHALERHEALEHLLVRAVAEEAVSDVAEAARS